MDAAHRRKTITHILEEAKAPVSAAALAREFSVSRQIIVGDVALLRAAGLDIAATPRGYVLPKETTGLVRTVACVHPGEAMARELEIMVDQGCQVMDVVVEHPVYGQRPSCPTQGVAGVAHRHKGKEHHGRRLEGIADGHRHGRAAHKGAQPTHGVAHVIDGNDLGGKKRNPELGPQGVEDGTNEQRAEQALGHSAQSVDAVALGGDDNVLPLHKFL